MVPIGCPILFLLILNGIFKRESEDKDYKKSFGDGASYYCYKKNTVLF